jgi:hypothetical protein
MAFRSNRENAHMAEEELAGDHGQAGPDELFGPATDPAGEPRLGRLAARAGLSIVTAGLVVAALITVVALVIGVAGAYFVVYWFDTYWQGPS